MPKILKVSGVLFISVIIVVTGCTKNNHSNTQEKETIKVGVIAPLTGGGARWGNALVKGIELAKIDLLDDSQHEYKILVEDVGLDAKSATNATNKLIRVDKVGALITTTSGLGNAVAPLAQEVGILHIAVCSDSEVAKIGKYNFNNLVFPEKEAEKWMLEAKKRGFEKVAIVNLIHPGIKAAIDVIIRDANQYGLEIVFEEGFSSDLDNFGTIFLKAQKTKPDIFLVLAFPPALDIIGQTYSELEIETPMSSIAAFPLSSQIDLFEGFWYVDAALGETDFVEKFEGNFPDIIFDARTTPFGYDSFNMLIEAFENGQVEPVEYLNNLETYHGVVGELTKTPDGRFDSEAGIWMIQDGKPVPVEE